MVKQGSSTFSAAVVVRSGRALGWTVENTLALEAEVSPLGTPFLSSPVSYSCQPWRVRPFIASLMLFIRSLPSQVSVTVKPLLFVRRWLM